MMDCLVIGCGLTGSAIARDLADNGKKVEIWERRDHVGGNMYDYVDDHGVLVHKYGPHTFHSNDKTLINYISRFCKWNDYRLTCGAEIDGNCTPTPFNYSTIDTFYLPSKAAELKSHIKASFGDRLTATVVECMEHSDPLIRAYAEFLFTKDYSLYTAKQWGVSPKEIDPSVLKRVPLRFSYDEGYFDDIYQVMPQTSFTSFFDKLLDHPNIIVKFNIEALMRLKVTRCGTALSLDGERLSKPVVYTGALDELFDCCEGNLPYRSLRFEWKYEKQDSLQKYPVVAYPQAEGYTRITEYKKLPFQTVSGTSYAMEYSLPYKNGERNEPYYPVLTQESQSQYDKYAVLASRIPNLFPVGRLADFKYYNMDQALRRAIDICKKKLI